MTQSRSTLGGADCGQGGDLPPQAKACLQPVADTVQFDDVIRKFENGMPAYARKGRLYVAAIVDLFLSPLVCTENSNPDVMMVKPAKDRV